MDKDKFIDHLASVIADVSRALGISDAEAAAANGSEELVAAIEALKLRAKTQIAEPPSPQQSANPRPDESAWLIERGPNQNQSPHVWLRLADGGNEYWTETATEALRFPSKKAAQDHARLHRIHHYVATEHAFVDASLADRVPRQDSSSVASSVDAQASGDGKQEREAFEKWETAMGNAWALKRWASGEYANEQVFWAWRGWQAARAPQPPREALTDEKILALAHKQGWFIETAHLHGTITREGLLAFARALLAAEATQQPKNRDNECPHLFQSPDGNKCYDCGASLVEEQPAPAAVGTQQQDERRGIEIGPLHFSRMRDGSLWIRHESGEGMQLGDETSLIELLGKFYTDNF